mmetsp:Transcript_168397/g.541017  ORF Transcript_168397/g.541017 Transcript_168397/m.541017 type:complete len:285 (+) Transcript_168397:107-961(+)
MSNVGRMDGGFFVSRSELLAWANNLLKLNLSKVEQCANGAVYCQVIDACHPGMVQMKKVNWSARDEHQCIPNFKVLQQTFDKVGIQRHIEVDKLVRGKYQDNLEMLQWIKTYHERTFQGGEYEPTSRRFADNLPEWARGAGGEANSRPSSSAGTGSAAAPRREVSGGGRSPPSSRPASGAGTRGPVAGGGGVASSGPSGTAGQMREEGERLRDEVVDLKITVDGLETERDFYFQKLRDIEILCQAMEARPDPSMTVATFVDSVQRILYAKDDDEEDEETGDDVQ